jgi:lysine 6-dehydrogenase
MGERKSESACLGGAGKIGSVVAWDLARDSEIESVGIVARRNGSLEKTRSWIASDKVIAHVLDITDIAATRRLMKNYDIAVIALPDRRSSYRTIEATIDAGCNALDVLEEYHRRPEAYETEGLEVPKGLSLDEYGESLHRRAIENGVTILDGMGFAPGLSNITLGEGIRKVNVSSAAARVGGIPSKESAERHPLKYMITWSFGHVLREYMVKVRVIQDGKLSEVDATSGRESFRFQECGKDEMLECAITPGMPSFLYTRPGLRDFAEKTIRWPGHWQMIDALKVCGLLDLEPFHLEGAMIRPRDFFLSLVEPKLRPLPGDRDVCVMWNTATGPEKRADYYMWAEADSKNPISAMAMVTGFSAAIGARLLCRGEIRQMGIVAPEDGIAGETHHKFLKELAKKRIIVEEIVSSI